MKADEKDILYHFFTSAEEYLSGYRLDRTAPVFADDAAIVNYESLADVVTAADSCTACPLSLTRTQVQSNTKIEDEGPSDGNRITVLVVDSNGSTFAGNEGQLLDKMLASIQLSRGVNCYIANIVKCSPPGNREPAPEEFSACMGFLEAQIALIRPVMILALGETAAKSLLRSSSSIETLRGTVHDRQGIPLLATFHPGALLRDESLKRPSWEDLKLFKAELESRIGSLPEGAHLCRNGSR